MAYHHLRHHPNPNPSSTTTAFHCCPPHHHSPPPPPPPLSSTTTTTVTEACFCQNHYHSPPPPPPPPSLDQLLQLLHSLLLQQQQQQQQQQQKPSCFSCNHQKHHQQQVLSSLAQRISDLETSLDHFSKTTTRQNSFSCSLRDAAAHVIQTHFRAFLARRSMTLRQLKELAFIKSGVIALKSSVSNNAHFDFDVVSRKAVEFLLKLDSIQGNDPMIRDGKKSITREVVRFSDFLDGISFERREVSYKSPNSVRFVQKVRALNGNLDVGVLKGNRRRIAERLRDQAEKIRGFSRVCKNDEEDPELEGFQEFVNGVEENFSFPTNAENGTPQIINGGLLKRHVGQSKVNKSVRFAENGNIYKVFGETGESASSAEDSVAGDDSNDEQEELIENHFDSSNEHGEAQVERAGLAQKSDAERNRRGNVEINLHCHDQDGNLVFSAPMPMKMEPRADLSKNQTAAKIVR